MARYANISTIGAAAVTADGTQKDEAVRERVENILTEQISKVLPDRPDLILLPEMCDVPRNFDAPRRERYLRSRGDYGIRFFASLAKEHHCNIAFSTYRFGDGDYTLNTMFIADRQGGIAGCYNKNHVVINGELDQNVRCGVEAPIIELDIGRVACVICFDLNFDVLRAHYKALKPEIILFSSMFHGGILQQVWAQSCRAYFVSAVADAWPSSVYAPHGEMMGHTTNYTNHATVAVNLDYALVHLDNNLEKLAAIKKDHGTGVKIHDPGNLGYVLLTSESAEFNAADLLRDYRIAALDDYLAASLAAHGLPGNRGREAVFR